MRGYFHISTAAVSSAAAFATFTYLDDRKKRLVDRIQAYSAVVSALECDEVASLSRQWRHLKNDTVEIEHAFQVGQAKLPKKPFRSPQWMHALGSSPSLYEHERYVELNRLRRLLNHYINGAGLRVIVENEHSNGCEMVFKFSPVNVHFVNKLLATYVGSLSNDEHDADDVLVALKKYEIFAKAVRHSDQSTGRAYSRELLHEGQLCNLCKLALPEDARCEELFRLRRFWDHRAKTEKLLEEIAQRQTEVATQEGSSDSVEKSQ
jgi:hypothetical protein